MAEQERPGLVDRTVSELLVRLSTMSDDDRAAVFRRVRRQYCFHCGDYLAGKQCYCLR